MSLNIIDLIKGQLGPALVSQAASQLGESESGISKAISGLLPAVVGGLANNSSNPTVLDAISGAASSGLLSNLLGGSTNNSLITSVISALFGDKLSGLLNGISKFAGVSESSSSSLLNLVTGAALGTVGKYATDNKLGVSGITSLLGDQKGILSTLLPAGLSLASLGLDFDNWFGKTKETVSSVASTAKDNLAEDVAVAKEKIEVTKSHIKEEYNKDNGGGSIWKWLLPLLLLLLAGWFLWKQCGKKEVTETVGTSDSTVVVSDSIAGDSLAAVSGVTKVDEDIDFNGLKLKGYKGGLEDRIITFLKGDGYKNAADDAALKDIWYDFDHVNFKIGSATELESGKEQLDNLVTILKAYPDAKIKIGGYTDKTGNEADNKKLSQARADFIKKYLTDNGVGAQVVAAEGYGSEFATVPATASNEERAVDRKMAVRFTK